MHYCPLKFRIFIEQKISVPIIPTRINTAVVLRVDVIVVLRVDVIVVLSGLYCRSISD